MSFARFASFFSQPFWSMGFRPFFALAMLSGASLPVIWVLAFSGLMPPPAHLSALQWHAHEMFYGFGWAVLGGFLLTATKNWVQIRGYHGPALALLLVAWVLERICMNIGWALPAPLFLIGANLFLPVIVLMLLNTLIRHRQNDSYDDNYFFLIILPAFVLAKNLMLSPDNFDSGVGMTLALFRVAFLVMLERTLTGFMRAGFAVDIRRDRWLDLPIKGLAVALVAAPWLPPMVTGGASIALFFLLLLRFALWKPHLAVTRIDIGVMYYGYLGIVVQLLAVSLDKLYGQVWVGSISVHLFTFGVMGLIIPAMLVRISNGHTGRPVKFDRRDKQAIYAMLAGFALRIIAPQLFPQNYLIWIVLSALCWLTCFSLLAWRYIPYYFQARVDGR